MWPVIAAWVRANMPLVVMPAAVVVGFVGYNLEDWLSDKYTPHRASALERREERRSREALEGVGDSFKVPSTIFDKNVSPGLEKNK